MALTIRINAMRIDLLTIFPEIFSGFLESSLIKKASESGLLDISVQNIRDHANPPHKQVDDTPYGGGAGMVMKPEPLVAAIEASKERLPDATVILLSPAGKLFTQADAERLKSEDALIFVCGRYEGIDERVCELMVDEEFSIGDYVLMGGEVPAMVIMEAVSRLQQNVLGNEESAVDESFSLDENEDRLLEAPHYTRPPEFRNRKVPEVLLSGNHEKIAQWRKEQSLEKTKKIRPDLLRKE